MLESQTPLEGSTAFYSMTERITGSFHGVPYSEVHYHLRPDHFALLPNSIGACSWADGCGAPRLNHQGDCACGGTCATCQQEDAMEPDTPRGWRGFLQMVKEFVTREEAAETPDALVVEQTDLDIRSALYGALAREMGEGVHSTPYFIQDLDVATQTFTYQEGERLKRRTWQMEEGLLTLAPDVEDVQRSTTYTPIPVIQEAQDTPQEEEPPMAESAPPHIKRRVECPDYQWSYELDGK